MKNFVVGTLLILSAALCAEESVSVRETSDVSFVATLASEKALSVEEAQQRLLATASDTCKDATPELGRYNFNSDQNISSPSVTDEKFEFNQEFTCTRVAGATPFPTSPTLVSEPEEQQLVDLVTSETRTFVASAETGTLQTLHSKFSRQLSTMLPLAEWVEQQVLLHNNAGPIQANPLFKVTTYVDPPNAPGPGIYLAVDFQVSYDGAPFRCGYVMWRFDQHSNLSVLRMEDGIIYRKEADSMTSEQLAQAKAQFRCFSP